MNDRETASSFREITVAGWVIIQATGTLEGTTADELTTRVRRRLAPGTSVAVDLHALGGDRLPVFAALEALQAEAATLAEVRLVVVEPDQLTREQLRAAGVVEVSESLDAALNVTAPLLREAGVPSPPQALAPASGDALLVASEDAVGRNRRP